MKGEFEQPESEKTEIKSIQGSFTSLGVFVLKLDSFSSILALSGCQESLKTFRIL